MEYVGTKYIFQNIYGCSTAHMLITTLLWKILKPLKGKDVADLSKTPAIILHEV